MFTDSLSFNLDLVKELLGDIPPSSKGRALKAARKVEALIIAMQREYPNDKAVALGAAFAIFILAQRIIESPKSGDANQDLIQLT